MRIAASRNTAGQRKGKVLAIVTSHDQLGGTGYRTGYWMPELAYPYLALMSAGYDVEVASPMGGRAPVDPYSDPGSPSSQPADALECTKLLAHEDHRRKLANTLQLSAIKREDYVAVWLVGGYGAALEFGGDMVIPEVVQALWNAGGVVGAIGHGTHGLLHVKTSDENLLIAGRDVTGFSKAEDQAVEQAVGFSFLPSYIEDELRVRSARYQCSDPFQPFAVASEDGRLVTGQQMFSGDVFGKKFIDALEEARDATMIQGE